MKTEKILTLEEAEENATYCRYCDDGVWVEVDLRKEK